ncbi:MAG: hypothetical protein Q9M94_04370 [Candidatus Gracilibacteria bacterium]|nr:hypothetical protein [Candidatus Gracilibacteria bacterium]
MIQKKRENYISTMHHGFGHIYIYIRNFFHILEEGFDKNDVMIEDTDNYSLKINKSSIDIFLDLFNEKYLDFLESIRK